MQSNYGKKLTEKGDTSIQMEACIELAKIYEHRLKQL